MDFSKIGNGAKITFLSGLILFIFSFLPWYGTSGFGFNLNINGWDSEFWAVFGIILGIVAVAILALKVFDVFDLTIGPFKAEQITFMVGILSAFFILLRWLTETDFVKYGLFISLIAAIGIAVGGFLAIREAGLEMPDMDDFRSIGGSGGGEPPPPPPPTE
jgi:hypothetical protein